MQTNANKNNNVAAFTLIFGALILFGLLVFSSYRQNNFIQDQLISIPEIVVPVDDIIVRVELHIDSDEPQNTTQITNKITQEIQNMDSDMITGRGSVSEMRSRLVTRLNEAGYNVNDIFVSDMSTTTNRVTS